MVTEFCFTVKHNLPTETWIKCFGFERLENLGNELKNAHALKQMSAYVETLTGSSVTGEFIFVLKSDNCANGCSDLFNIFYKMKNYSRFFFFDNLETSRQILVATSDNAEIIKTKLQENLPPEDLVQMVTKNNICILFFCILLKPNKHASLLICTLSPSAWHMESAIEDDEVLMLQKTEKNISVF